MVTNNNSIYIAPSIETGTWNLQDDTECGNRDGKLQEAYAAEMLEISGVPVNVFRLLGVHEQGILVDLTGNGYPVSSGSAPSHNDANAFNLTGLGWRSIQTGVNVLSTPAFIGYNFGIKTTVTGTTKYAPSAPIRRLITTLKLQQGVDPLNRVLQIKIERSDDGATWTRVDIVNVPNTANLETINIKASVPSAYWRIIPMMFNGASDTSAYWEVIKLELMDFEATSLDNIEDLFFMENRDRDYATASIQLKAYYQPFDSIGDMSKFGFNFMEQYSFTVSFAKMVEALGRPIVIGDIIELPCEMQYDHHLRPVKQFLEITDASWSSDGYTTGWRPMLYRFQASQLIPAAENKDVIKAATGDSLNFADGSQMSDSDFFSNVAQIDKSSQRASDTIKALAADAVPEAGIDSSSIEIPVANIPIDSTIKQSYGVEDGLPPNGLPFTEGFVLPDATSSTDGQYFRLNYPNNTQIPARLFRFSSVKHKWIYVETDRRQSYSSFKPSMKAILQSSTKIDLRDI